MNTQKIDLAGKRYGRWVVIEQAEPGKGYSTRWLCKCDCGTVKSVDGQLLRTGKSQSCGCMREERRIQIPNSIMNDDERLRAIYISIRSACEQPKDPKYHKFGGKGITVCDEWKRSFQAFTEWSKKNGYTSEAFLLFLLTRLCEVRPQHLVCLQSAPPKYGQRRTILSKKSVINRLFITEL